MKRISFVIKIKNLDTEASSGKALRCYDKKSQCYRVPNRSTNIYIKRLIGEFEHDDIVRLTMTKIGKAKF